MSKVRCFKERTPKGMMDRITRKNGGGGHRDKKNDYRRKSKHRNKDVAW